RGSEALPATKVVLQGASSGPVFKGRCQAVTFLAKGEMLWEVLSVQIWAGLCHGVTVTQKERFKTIQAGTQSSITCEHDDNNYVVFYWYRQKLYSGRTGLQLIGLSVQGNSPQMENKNYTIYRQNVTHASLRIPPGCRASKIFLCCFYGTVRAPSFTAAHELCRAPVPTFTSCLVEGLEALSATKEVFQGASSGPGFKGKCQAVTFLAKGEMLWKCLVCRYGQDGCDIRRKVAAPRLLEIK
ncbi:hypothetical protein E2320_000025, partial [Naja naja]